MTHKDPEDKAKLLTLAYHDIFDYPLNHGELIKWIPGEKALRNYKIKSSISIETKGKYIFLEGKSDIAGKRIVRERIWRRKIKIAKQSAEILKFIPWIAMVGITGSLAMKNCNQDSDIDLLIICKKKTLWLSRLFSILLLTFFGISIRKSGDKVEKDKLCLNMWLDETSLSWPASERNIYTAHEICQIVPLINKDKAYEKFIWMNKWVKDFWPNAVKFSSVYKSFSSRSISQYLNILISLFLEPFAFRFQYWYMKSKITNEEISFNKAIFHPKNLSKLILSSLNAYSQVPS